MSEVLSGVRALSAPLVIEASEALKVVEALRALPDRPGLAALLVSPELWALLVKQVGTEVMAPLAHKARLDLPDLPVPAVRPGRRARTALPCR